MKQSELKQFINEMIVTESELVTFAIKCLKRIYGAQADLAEIYFRRDYEQMDSYGDLPDLEYYDEEIQKVVESRKKYQNEVKA